MSDPSQKPWSNNPNTPQIPYDLYLWEKAAFAGGLIGAILYGLPTYISICSVLLTSLVRSTVLGIVIVMFFQCITALFNPANRRREGIKWGLVIYTVLMFSFVTIRSVMALNLVSISFIDNREFPGVGDQLPPGPIGYTLLACPKATSVVLGLMFLLNNWLANALLASFSLPFTHPEASHRLLFQLYRCYVIYAMNLWAIAFPSLMYLGSLGAYLILPHVGGALG